MLTAKMVARGPLTVLQPCSSWLIRGSLDSETQLLLPHETTRESHVLPPSPLA